MADTGDKVIRVYSDFRGIDLRGEECALNRSPDALNVWRDYRELSGIKTRPALKKFTKVAEEENHDTSISAIRWHDNSQSVDSLHVLTKDGRLFWMPTGSDISDGWLEVGKNGTLFSFQGVLYVKGANGYWNAYTGQKVEGVAPITSVGALPNGSGRKTHQDVNLLTPYRINTFTGDGESFDYVLDAQGIDDEKPVIELDGKDVFYGKTLVDTNTVGQVTEYLYGQDDRTDYLSVDRKNGILRIIKDSLPLPKPEGAADNISIKFKKTVKDSDGNDANKDKILGCTIVQEFDNRIFLSGNKDYPNLVFHSSLNDVAYFSDLDVYEDGKDDGKIRAMVAGNNALWVFRDTDKGNGVYYHTAAFDETYGKVYPSAHSSVSMGCVGGAVNFLDDILFFSREGMEGITQNVTAEQFATHKSSLVDREMLQNKNYKDLVLAEWEGYLIVFIGSEAYLADSRAVLANEGHYEYEWYRWQLFKNNKDSVTCATVHNGQLYIGTKEGYIYTFDKDTKAGDEYYYEDKSHAPIESYWTTPRDKFASSNKQKTTNKKGCIVEALGDLIVSSKVDGDDGFDDGEVYTGIKDHVVPKIKRKKFKDIQLKFKSNTKFKLESVTLEAFVGSFIKR